MTKNSRIFAKVNKTPKAVGDPLSMELADSTSATYSSVEICPDAHLMHRIYSMLGKYQQRHGHSPIGLILGPEQYLTLNVSLWNHNIRNSSMDHYKDLTEFAGLPIRVCLGANISLEIDPKQAVNFVENK